MIRLETLDRDGWRCQDCGKAGALEAHHVMALEDGGSNALGNLLTVCRDCHIKAHRDGRQDSEVGPGGGGTRRVI